MRLKFLGDAYDHWKGSVFECLQQLKLLNDFRVDAMAGDQEAWRPEHYALYAKLLRIERDQLVSHACTCTLKGNRAGYFDKIPAGGDLFLDPDTGIRTGRVKDPCRYVTPAEIVSLLKRNKDRVIAVYQHVQGKGTRHRVEEVLDALHNLESRFFCISYESSTVALLFISLRHERVEAIKNHFHVLLGGLAKDRIGEWPAKGQPPAPSENRNLGQPPQKPQRLPPEPVNDWEGPVTLRALDPAGNLWRNSKRDVVNEWMDANRMVGYRLWVCFLEKDVDHPVLFVPFANQGWQLGGMKCAQNCEFWRDLVREARRDSPVDFQIRYKYEAIEN